MSRRRSTGWWLLLGLGLLAACGGGEADGSVVCLEGCEDGGGGGGANTTTTASTTKSTTSTPTSTATGTTTETDPAAGGAGGAGGAGEGGGEPDPPPVCVDQGVESNETEADAAKLTEKPINDCNENGNKVSGTIAGKGDIDWYVYVATDDFGCSVDPTRDLMSKESALRVCAYYECLKGKVDIGTCPVGTDAGTSPDGRPGCCGAFGFKLEKLDCSGTLSDDAKVFLRVDHPTAKPGACHDYTLTYHY